jgi:hypothetical protein
MPVMKFVITSDENRAKLISTTALPQPGQPLTTDWMQNAVSHYMHHFVLSPENGLAGMHDSLPALCMQYPGTTYLHSAIRAVSMANFARLNKMNPEYLSWAYRSYLEAVQSLRIALNDMTERTSATALMTTEILSEYDVGSSIWDK